MAWATASEALALTGATVDDDQLDQAQGVVELFAGITEANTADLGANRRLLRAAVAYQAVWMAAQIDVATRTDVSSLTQDGAGVTPAHADALILAPLAKRALDRLSWRHGPRSTRINRATDTPRFQTLAEAAAAFMRDETHDCWRPL